VVVGFKYPPFIGDDLEDTGPSIELDPRQRRARRGEGLLRIEARPGYKLYVVHADGRAAEIDMSDDLRDSALASLREPVLFAQARLDKWGVPSWPDGTDLAPEFLEKKLSEQVPPAPTE
jgi:hypothetical protein